MALNPTHITTSHPHFQPAGWNYHHASIPTADDHLAERDFYRKIVHEALVDAHLAQPDHGRTTPHRTLSLLRPAEVRRAWIRAVRWFLSPRTEGVVMMYMRSAGLTPQETVAGLEMIRGRIRREYDEVRRQRTEGGCKVVASHE